MKIRKAALSVVFLGLLLVGGSGASPSSQQVEQVETARPSPLDTLGKDSDEAAQPQIKVDVTLEQVKIFQDSDETWLQKYVNNWLSKNSGKIEIVRVLQSQSGGRFGDYPDVISITTITIFYKKIR